MTSLGCSEKDATSSIDKSQADSPELAENGNVAEILRANVSLATSGFSPLASSCS